MAAKRTAQRSAGRKKIAKKTATKKKVSKKKSSSKGSSRSTSRAKTKPALEDPRVEQVRELMDVMVRSGAVELEVREGDSLLRIRLRDDSAPMVAAPVVAQPVAQTVAQPMAAEPPRPAAASVPPAEEGEVFPSPMVGTFYRAASPEAEPFVGSGDSFGPETTLCIIEAMKVMNEIKAETSGQIIDILVQNGEPVEFGQPLFRIRK